MKFNLIIVKNSLLKFVYLFFLISLSISCDDSAKIIKLTKHADHLDDINKIDKVRKLQIEKLNKYFPKSSGLSFSDELLQKVDITPDNPISSANGFFAEMDFDLRHIKNQFRKKEYLEMLEKRAKYSSRTDLDLRYLRNQVSNSTVLNAEESKDLHNAISLSYEEGKLSRNGLPINNDQIKKVFNGKSKIVLDGKIDELLVNKISRLNTTFVLEATSLPRRRVVPDIIYVKQPTDNLEVAQLFDKAEYGIKVNTKEDLMVALEQCKERFSEPILVFDNYDGFLFGTTLSEFGVKNVITCKSYSLSNSSVIAKTTDFINAKDMVKSLDVLMHTYGPFFNKIKEKALMLNSSLQVSPEGCLENLRLTSQLETLLENNPGYTIYLDEFYFDLSSIYIEKLRQREIRNCFAVFGGGLTVSGGVFAIVYNKRNKAK